MRILFYNWTNFDGRAGGGVSVYLRNVMPELLRRDGVEVWFLSSGEHYGVLKRRPYIEETGNLYSDQRVRSFRVINSPIKAPAHDAFYSADKWRESADLFHLIRDFMRRHGPFDVFHLHSLEGISANVLAMGQALPDTRVFFSLHNYMPYCPQIELLHAGARPCLDFRDGTKCVGCLPSKNSMPWLITRRRLASSLSRHGLAGHPIGNFVFGMGEGLHQVGRSMLFAALDVGQGIKDGFQNWCRRTEEPSKTKIDRNVILPPPPADDLGNFNVDAKNYAAWRRNNAALLNRSVARVFAVSDLVKETVGRIGESTANIDVLPLAMDLEASRQEMLDAFDAKPRTDAVTISFIGYDIPSKGLPFLLEAFDAFDSDFLRKRVKLQVICRTNAQGRRRIFGLSEVFREVEVLNGYNRENLPGIARQIDLNIVPSIWPETFNQVTFELMALGTPSLVSDLVGAKQLFGTAPAMKDFVFRASSVEDFKSKLLPLVEARAKRRAFFENAPPLPTIKEHVDALLGHYRETMRPLAPAPLDAAPKLVSHVAARPAKMAS